MKSYEFILLDWDGCLAKSLEIILSAYKAIFAEYGIYPKDTEVTQKVFGDWNGPKKLGIKDVATYTQKFLAKVDEKYPEVKLYKGVRKTLEALIAKDKKLALITTSKMATIKPALKNNNLEDFFDAVLTAEDVVSSKPDPEIIYKAIEKLKGVKEKAIIVGDSKSDLEAGTNAGIDAVLFYPKENHIFYDLNMLKSYKPTYIVEDFTKILEIIR